METARSVNFSGATTIILVAPSAQLAWMEKLFGVDAVGARLLEWRRPHSAAICIAGVPGTRPPIWSVSRCRLAFER